MLLPPPTHCTHFPAVAWHLMLVATTHQSPASPESDTGRPPGLLTARSGRQIGASSSVRGRSGSNRGRSESVERVLQVLCYPGEDMQREEAAGSVSQRRSWLERRRHLPPVSHRPRVTPPFSDGAPRRGIDGQRAKLTSSVIDAQRSACLPRLASRSPRPASTAVVPATATTLAPHAERPFCNYYVCGLLHHRRAA